MWKYFSFSRKTLIDAYKSVAAQQMPKDFFSRNTSSPFIHTKKLSFPCGCIDEFHMRMSKREEYRYVVVEDVIELFHMHSFLLKSEIFELY